MHSNESPDDLDSRLVDAFARELEHQYDLASMAFASLQQALTENHQDTNVYWYHVESAVKSLMSMTNILWSQNNRNPYKRRARILREKFNLESFELPADLRATRHALEHFDERLDDWWRQDIHHNIVDRNIAPRSLVTGLPMSSFARNFDPSTWELSVFGSSVNLIQAMQFMQKVLVSITLSGATRQSRQTVSGIHPRNNDRW